MINLCDFCQSRFTWDCEDSGPYADIGGCVNFNFDMRAVSDNELRKSINKSIQVMLALYDANREEE